MIHIYTGLEASLHVLWLIIFSANAGLVNFWLIIFKAILKNAMLMISNVLSWWGELGLDIALLTGDTLDQLYIMLMDHVRFGIYCQANPSVAKQVYKKATMHKHGFCCFMLRRFACSNLMLGYVLLFWTRCVLLFLFCFNAACKEVNSKQFPNALLISLLWSSNCLSAHLGNIYFQVACKMRFSALIRICFWFLSASPGR